MYFLIGAIVSTVVLVIPSLLHLVYTIALLGPCPPDSLHPSQADQPSDPSVPRGRPCCARHAPPRPRPPPYISRPCHHHCHLDLWHSLDIHCRRPCGGFGDQIHQVHARHIPLVDAMVRNRVVVGTIIPTLIVTGTFPSQYILFLQANDMSLDEMSLNLTLTTIDIVSFSIYYFCLPGTMCLASYGSPNSALPANISS